MFYKYSGLYSVDLCRRYPDLTFIFGDNLLRTGKGGQAIIRDEPNALGVPTKHLPRADELAYFNDATFSYKVAVLESLIECAKVARDRGVIVPIVPGTDDVSLGLGLADLQRRAPSIYAIIQNFFNPSILRSFNPD